MSKLDNMFISAVQKNQKAVVMTFLKKGGIDVNKRDELGFTSLYYACEKGSKDIVKLLLENDADVSMPSNDSKTCLHAVAKTGNKDIIQMLVDAGSDIDALDKEDKTPLMYFIQNKKTESALLLLSLGADKTLLDSQGHSAKDYASAGGLKDLLDVLMSDQDVNEKDQYGNSLLHQAIHNNNSEVVKTLLAKEETIVDALNDASETPLINAVKKGSLIIVELLLAKSANVNLSLQNGTTCLHIASSNNYLDIAKALIKNGAELNTKNENGSTALINAAKNGHNDFTAFLIEKEADVNLVDNYGQSALFYATENGYNEIVEQLIMAGCEE